MIPARSVLAVLALAAAAAAQTPAPPKPAVSADEDKGRELFKAGKYEEAVEQFRKAQKANPLLPPPRVVLAELFFQTNQGSNARVALERAAGEDPDHPAVLLMNASFALPEGRLTDVVLSCQAALKAADSPRWDAEQRKKFTRDARSGLAAGYEARRDFTAAKEQLAALAAAEPKNAVFRSRLGAALFLTGKTEEAAAELATAFADDPTLDPPELSLARLWAARPDAIKAEEWFKKASAAHPKNPRVAREFAGWLLNVGRVEDARPQVAAAAAVDAAARDTLALSGLLARYTKDHAAAEAAFTKLVQESPKDRFAGLNLALVLAESADPAKPKRAVELAETLVTQNPKAADGYAVLGWCLYKAGRLDEAQASLAKSASGGQVERDTAYYLARVQFDKNQPDDSRKLLKEALAAPGPFVNKAAAEALAAEVDKKFPPKPEEKKP